MIQRKLHSKDAPRQRASNESTGERRRKANALLYPIQVDEGEDTYVQASPAPESAKSLPSIIKKPAEDDAAMLARRFRMDVYEVQDVIKAMREAERRRGSKKLEFGDMHEVLKAVFGVQKVEETVVDQAYESVCGPMSPKRDSDKSSSPTLVERFLTWYQVNMFKNVAATLSPADQMSYQLSSEHNVTTMVIDKVWKQFDAYDTDKSGKIEYAEFLQMLIVLLGAKSQEDISEDRVLRFWREIDADGSGEVDFPEFVAWYLKYWDPKLLEQGVVSGPVSQFYASFNPVLVRNQR